MRWALLADVHGNLEALQATLADVASTRVDAVLVAGDLVGYLADPEACVTVLRAAGALCVAGNHEGMVLGGASFDHCVHSGIRAALWTRRALSPSSRSFLAGLPRLRAAPPDLLVCHGDLEDACHYVTQPPAVHQTFAQASQLLPSARVVVCGHAHRQLCCREADVDVTPPPLDVPLPIGRGRVLLNPGSVGQSRDQAALARWALYDAAAGTVMFRALPYDVDGCLAKARAAGLVARVTARPDHEVWGRRADRWRTTIGRRLARHPAGASALALLGGP